MTRTKTAIWNNDEELVLVNEMLAFGLEFGTVSQYMDVIRQAKRWCEENGFDLDTLQAVDLRALAESTPYTFSSRMRLRQGLLNYWIVRGRTNPPIKAIRSPRRPVMFCRALDEGPAAALEEAARARGDAKGLAVLCGLYLALRRFEIARLHRDMFSTDYLWVTFEGKGNKQATLPVHEILVDALVAYGATGWLFPGRFGNHVVPATIWDWVRQVAIDAQLGEINTHVLRHTSLATANDATGDLRAVQDFARHAKPETTSGYTRVRARRLKVVSLSLDYAQAARRAAQEAI